MRFAGIRWIPGERGGRTEVAMIARGGVRIDELAERSFHLITRLLLTLPRGRLRHGELKDLEFLTLAILQRRQRMIVGDISASSACCRRRCRA